MTEIEKWKDNDKLKNHYDGFMGIYRNQDKYNYGNYLWNYFLQNFNFIY